MTVEQNESHWTLRLEGDYSLTSAGEFKALLLQGLASEKKLQVNLERAGEIDITLLQLLWAAARGNQRLETVVSEAIAGMAHNAGFESFPGEAVQG